jgi:hypothetical protein
MTKQRIDRALERFRAGEKDLYTEEGQKLYSEEEHERRYDALLAEFDREKDSVVSEADRAIEKAEHTLTLEHRDLSDSLSTEELERANAKRSYIEDDVWSLPLEALLKRVKAAQTAGDKPTMFLYARTLERRVSMEYESGNVTEHTARAVRDLETLAPELAQAVRGQEAERDLERARKAKEDAFNLKIYTTEVRNKADGTEDRLYQEARQRYRQMF